MGEDVGCPSAWWKPCNRSYGGVRKSDSRRLNDSLETEQSDEGLIRVGLSSDSSQDQGWPPEAYHQRLMLAKAPPMELFKFEENKD